MTCVKIKIVPVNIHADSCHAATFPKILLTFSVIGLCFLYNKSLIQNTYMKLIINTVKIRHVLLELSPVKHIILPKVLLRIESYLASNKITKFKKLILIYARF